MLRKALQWIILSIPVVYLLLSLGIVAIYQYYSYDQLLDFYVRVWPTAFDPMVFAQRCMTPSWYKWVTTYAVWLETVIVVCMVVYVLLFKAIKKLVMQLLGDSNQVLVFMKRVLQGLTMRERWMLLGLFVLIGCYRLYFFCQFPLHPDEAASYLFFTRQGTLMSAINYVTTNNHVFLNVVCSFLAKLPFLSPKWVMRLPAMTGDIALLLGLFCLVKQLGNYTRAIGVVAGLAFNYILAYYATQGRGYQWQEICTVVSTGSCWLYFFSPAAFIKKGYGLFIASSVIGFYINPLFVYPFLTIMLSAGYLFIRRGKLPGMVAFIKAVMLIGVFTFLLYLPVILFSSWNALVNNGFINAHQHLSELAGEVGDLIFSFNYITNYGSAGIGVLAAGVIASLYLYRRKFIDGLFYRMMLVWFVASAFSFVVITVYQKVFPLERAMCFWILIVDLIFLLVLYDVFNRLFAAKGVRLFGIIIMAKVAFSVRTIHWPRYAINNKEQVIIYNNIQPQFDQLLTMGASTWQITDADDYYSMFLPLYLKAHNKPEAIVLNRKQGLADVIFLPDTYFSEFDLTGYKLWKEEQVTAKGKRLSIYAKEKLINR